MVVSMLLGLSAGGVWWWKQRLASETPAPPPAAPVAAAPTAPPAPGSEAPGATATAPAPGATAATAPTAAAAAPTSADPLKASGLSHASIRIDGPLETAITTAAGAAVGPALAQVVTRTLVWWIDVPGDLRRNEEPLVYAVRFTSNKTGQTHRTYRFQAEGDKNPRYYLPSGEELELRLENSPLDDYEQVTSLLRDGRRHKGVDFKTPVGTPVKAPFTGIVRRKNWSFRFNGNCLDLEEAGGKSRHALMLHMEELPHSLKVGDRIAAGTVLGRSGNSGHSFAPHLHYQLEAADERVLDPYESHRTYRRSLVPSQRAAFEAEMRRQDGLLGTTVAGG
jgi:murein DD-endopeptidase MepM/ murein hydrolase activator NlpD